MSYFQYLTKKLGVDPVVFGYLQTTFAVFQLVGGPVFGRFGDMYGGRAAMTLAFMSATLSYGLTGLAVSVPLLFLSRLPSVFMHAMQGIDTFLALIFRRITRRKVFLVGVMV